MLLVLGVEAVVHVCHTSMHGIWQECLHNLKTLSQMVVDVSSGILHMHSKSVIHCDISARNCLVDR